MDITTPTWDITDITGIRFSQGFHFCFHIQFQLEAPHQIEISPVLFFVLLPPAVRIVIPQSQQKSWPILTDPKNMYVSTRR